MELSLDEVKELARRVGFDIHVKALNKRCVMGSDGLYRMKRRSKLRIRAYRVVCSNMSTMYACHPKKLDIAT